MESLRRFLVSTECVHDKYSLLLMLLKKLSVLGGDGIAVHGPGVGAILLLIPLNMWHGIRSLEDYFSVSLSNAKKPVELGS